MVPPPKPATLDGTVVCEIANVPRVASMLATVGSGPRWNGLSAAYADGGAAATLAISASATEIRATATRATVTRAAVRTGRREVPGGEPPASSSSTSIHSLGVGEPRV